MWIFQENKHQHDELHAEIIRIAFVKHFISVIGVGCRRQDMVTIPITAIVVVVVRIFHSLTTPRTVATYCGWDHHHYK